MRILDLLASSLGIIFLSPLFLIISILIKLTSPGPVFHRGKRVGRNGELFSLYKFRTMIANAASIGPGITTESDPRITPLGRILRQTKIDELPQLLNVLKGDMSLVGPRPEHPRYVAQYSSEQKEILNVRPGITSAASLAFRREEQMLSGPDWETTYCTEVLPAKLKMDLDYFSERTLWSDIFLIIRTIYSIFR
ncbi:MAG: sugar transferase [Deltaproteobacteria bacterium]|nr:sugar transferase [Deltaproteobacteria bacterium]